MLKRIQTSFNIEAVIWLLVLKSPLTVWLCYIFCKCKFVSVLLLIFFLHTHIYIILNYIVLLCHFLVFMFAYSIRWDDSCKVQGSLYFTCTEKQSKTCSEIKGERSVIVLKNNKYNETILAAAVQIKLLHILTPWGVCCEWHIKSKSHLGCSWMCVSRCVRACVPMYAYVRSVKKCVLRVRMAWGKKFFLSLLVLALRLQRRLPDLNSVSRLLLGCDMSFMIRALVLTVDVLQGGDSCSDSAFSWVHHSLQGTAIMRGAVPIPSSDAACQDALHSRGIKGPQDGGWDFELPQLLEKVGFFLNMVWVWRVQVRSLVMCM